MKIRPWLSVLIPPALLALVLWLPLRANDSSPYSSPYLYIIRTPDLLIEVSLGMILGLTIPLTCLAAGSKALRLNGSALLAGAVILVCSIIAPLAAETLLNKVNYNYNALIFLFLAITPQAAAIFGGILLIGSISFRTPGKSFTINSDQIILLLIMPLVIYVLNTSLSIFLIRNILPPDIPQSPVYRVISVIRSAFVLISMVFIPITAPVCLHNKLIKKVMIGYGILFSLMTLVLLTGSIMWSIEMSENRSDALLDTNNIFIAPMATLMQTSPYLFNSIFVLTGLYLKLGFSRIPAKSAE